MACCAALALIYVVSMSRWVPLTRDLAARWCAVSALRGQSQLLCQVSVLKWFAKKIHTINPRSSCASAPYVIL